MGHEIEEESVAPASRAELADWIIGLSAGTTPEELAGQIRSRLQAVK